MRLIVFLAMYVVIVVVGELWRSAAIGRKGRTPIPLPLVYGIAFVAGALVSILASLLNNHPLKLSGAAIMSYAGLIVIPTSLLEFSKSKKVPWLVTAAVSGFGVFIAAACGTAEAVSSCAEGLSCIGYGLLMIFGFMFIALGASFAFVIVARSIASRHRTKHAAMGSPVS